MGGPLNATCCFSLLLLIFFSLLLIFYRFDYCVSLCVPPWVYPAWDSLCFQDLTISFPMLRNFSAIISSSISSGSLSFSSSLSEWVKSFSCVQLFVIPWTVAYQAPLSMGFSRQEYWNGLPFPSPGDLPYPGIEPGSSTSQADALPSEPPGEPSSSLGTHIMQMLVHLLLSQRSLGMSSFLFFHSFFLYSVLHHFHHSVFQVTYPLFYFSYSTIDCSSLVFLLFSSPRSLVNISCIVSILFPRTWIVFTIIILNHFSGRLPLSTS